MARSTPSGETWKCVLINRKTRGRRPFFAHTPWAAKHEAQYFLKANKCEDQYLMKEPEEVFKKGIDWNVAVAI